jgi:hypothetical protein
MVTVRPNCHDSESDYLVRNEAGRNRSQICDLRRVQGAHSGLLYFLAIVLETHHELGR